jgi:tetratricopeptide (TPR) repeat protein
MSLASPPNPNEPGPPLSEQRRTARAVFLITLAGAMLRLAQLWDKSLLFDEFVFLHTLEVPTWIGAILASPAPHGPLMAFIFWPLRAWLGSDIALHLGPWLAGSSAIPLMYLCGRRMFDIRTGVWAAFFVALCPSHIVLSGLFEPYAFLLSFLLLAVLCVVRAAETESGAWSALAGVLMALSIYTHPFAAFALGLVTLGIVGYRLSLGQRWAALWQPGLSWILVFALYVPWMAKQMGRTGQYLGTMDVDPIPWWEHARSSLSMPWFGSLYLDGTLTLPLLLAGGAILLLFLGRSWSRKAMIVITLLWVLTGLVCDIACTLAGYGPFGRYLLSAVPGIALVLGGAAAWLTDGPGEKPSPFPAKLAALFAVGLWTAWSAGTVVGNLQTTPFENFRDAARWMARVTHEDDRVVATFGQPYVRMMLERYQPDLLPLMLSNTYGEFGETARTALGEGRRVWLFTKQEVSHEMMREQLLDHRLHAESIYEIGGKGSMAVLLFPKSRPDLASRSSDVLEAHWQALDVLGWDDPAAFSRLGFFLGSEHGLGSEPARWAWGQAASHYDRLLRWAPLSWEIRQALSDKSLLLGDPERARVHADMAIRLASNFNATAKRKEADRLFLQATTQSYVAMARAGAHKRALAELDARFHETSRPELLHVSARIAAAHESSASALERYTLLWTRFPEHDDLWYLTEMGNLFLEEDQTGDALRCFARAAEAHPESLLPAVYQAKALCLMNRHPEAAQNLLVLMEERRPNDLFFYEQLGEALKGLGGRGDWITVSPDRRGLHVAVIDPASGLLADYCTFDTYRSENEADRAAAYLRSIPDGFLFAIITRQEAFFRGLRLVEALRNEHGLDLPLDPSWKDATTHALYRSSMLCVQEKGGRGPGVVRIAKHHPVALRIAKDTPLPGSKTVVPLDILLFAATDTQPHHGRMLVAPSALPGEAVLVPEDGRAGARAAWWVQETPGRDHVRIPGDEPTLRDLLNPVRGVHFAVVDPADWTVADYAWFDTYQFKDHGPAAAAFLASVPDEMLVLGVVHGEALFHGLDWVRALREYFGLHLPWSDSWQNGTEHPLYRNSLAFVAMRGAPYPSGEARVSPEAVSMILCEPGQPLPGLPVAAPGRVVLFSGGEMSANGGQIMLPGDWMGEAFDSGGWRRRGTGRDRFLDARAALPANVLTDDRRGLHMVLLDAITGEPLGYDVFDTYQSADEASRAAAFLDEAPDGCIVACVVRGEALFRGLGAVRALRETLNAYIPLEPDWQDGTEHPLFRSSLAVLGVKGGGPARVALSRYVPQWVEMRAGDPTGTTGIAAPCDLFLYSGAELTIEQGFVAAGAPDASLRKEQNG